MSFEASGRKQFPKSQKSPESYLGGAGGAAAAADDDDDDVDLFGSDDEEEDAEAAKVREERLAAYAGKIQMLDTPSYVIEGRVKYVFYPPLLSDQICKIVRPMFRKKILRSLFSKN